jgi:hypothetical protein
MVVTPVTIILLFGLQCNTILCCYIILGWCLERMIEQRAYNKQQSKKKSRLWSARGWHGLECYRESRLRFVAMPDQGCFTKGFAYPLPIHPIAACAEWDSHGRRRRVEILFFDETCRAGARPEGLAVASAARLLAIPVTANYLVVVTGEAHRAFVGMRSSAWQTSHTS